MRNVAYRKHVLCFSLMFNCKVQFCSQLPIVIIRFLCCFMVEKQIYMSSMCREFFCNWGIDLIEHRLHDHFFTSGRNKIQIEDTVELVGQHSDMVVMGSSQEDSVVTDSQRYRLIHSQYSLTCYFVNVMASILSRKVLTKISSMLLEGAIKKNQTYTVLFTYLFMFCQPAFDSALAKARKLVASVFHISLTIDCFQSFSPNSLSIFLSQLNLLDRIIQDN